MRVATLVALLVGCLLSGVGPAHAGANAGARARIYWQVGDGPGLADRNSDSDSMIQVVVTVRGVRDLRGADVQLTLEGAGSLPPYWQAQPGGCAESLAVFKPGGFGGAYPDAFISGTPIVGMLTMAHGMFYQVRRNPCITPDSTGTIWLATAGAAGEARDSTVEYALCAFRLDLRKARAACPGGARAAGSQGLCLYVNNHIPCIRTAPTMAITVVDNLTVKDFVPVDSAYSRLTWKGGACHSPKAPAAPKKAPSGK